MFVLKRNQIIITALIVMIAVAGYLNYQDSRASTHTGITLNDQGEIDALAPSSLFDIGNAYTYDVIENPDIAMEHTDAYISGDASTIDNFANVPSEEDPGASVFVSATNGNVDTSFFIRSKFEREQNRSKEKSTIMELINNQNLDQDKKAEAADALLEIQKRIEKESAAEALIEAKGFFEVYVRIGENSVDVIVGKEALTDAEQAQIMDIVKRKTGMTEDKIHISPKR